MTSHRLFLSSGAVVAIGLAVELGAQFARTVLLARVLGAEEFGIVAAIYAVYAIVEMAGFIGLERYIVYSARGGDSHVLDASHTLAVARGVLSALVLVIFAAPAASLIGEAQYVDSFIWVAAVPFLRGFLHLGVTQMQREGTFWRGSVAEAGGALIGLAVAAIAARLLHDHRAGVWALVAQQVAAVAASHVLAWSRKYRFSFDRAPIAEALRFGLPLTVNGLAVAIATQVDRLVVGAWLGVETLGLYSLTISVVLQPLSLVFRLVTTLVQPHLSQAWHEDPSGRFRAQARRVVFGSGLMGLVYAGGIVCLGAPVMHFVFGARYVFSDSVFALYGAAVLLRFVRNGLSLFGLAIGRTSGLMVSNLAGAFGLLAGLAALYVRPTIEAAIFGIVVGDVISFFVLESSIHAYVEKQGRPVLTTLAAASAPPAILAVLMLAVNPDLPLRIAATVLIAALAAIALMRFVGSAAGLSRKAA